MRRQLHRQWIVAVPAEDMAHVLVAIQRLPPEPAFLARDEPQAAAGDLPAPAQLISGASTARAGVPRILRQQHRVVAVAAREHGSHQFLAEGNRHGRADPALFIDARGTVSVVDQRAGSSGHRVAGGRQGHDRDPEWSGLGGRGPGLESPGVEAPDV
ncbi:MAG: hypothetical protein FJY99_07560 [Candidatus Sericytochromatia bacterium]|nr:hypothetical protein [Candidatus Tanganyikabacteria bacterium]